ncbi:MAG: hypothetical protein WB626_11465 [Bacteroidota bacterium]
MLTPDALKKIRTRAVRLRRLLANEEKAHGAVDDGAGKRYLIGPLFVQCGDLAAALEHYAWYERACGDDCGEPIHYLFWTLALYRSGDRDGAREKLLETMIQNIYLLPELLGTPVKAEEIWHCSNWVTPGYMTETPGEFVPVLSEEERAWIAGELETDRFRRVKAEYVSTFGALKHERDIKARRAILDRWNKFWAGRSSLAG